MLTEEQAAELARCTVETLVSHLKAGRLAGAKLGRSWVIPKVAFIESLNRLAEDQMKKRQAPTPRPGRRRPLVQLGA